MRLAKLYGRECLYWYYHCRRLTGQHASVRCYIDSSESSITKMVFPLVLDQMNGDFHEHHWHCIFSTILMCIGAMDRVKTLRSHQGTQLS